MGDRRVSHGAHPRRPRAAATSFPSPHPRREARAAGMKLVNLLRYVTLAQWRANALRTALTTLGLALGVAVIVAMRLVNGAVFESIRASVDDVAGRAVLSVTNGQAGVPEELLERVRAVPGVRAAAALILDSGLVMDHPERGERLQVFGVDYLADSEVRRYELEEDDGSEMEDPIVVLSQPDSVFVTRDFATRHGLHLNSRLPLQIATGPKELVVRGILKEAGPAKAFGGMLALMDIYAAQLAFGKGVAGEPGRFDQIDVVLDPALDDAAEVEAARDRIAAAVAGTAAVARPENRGEQMESMLGATKLGFAQAQALAFIVGVFLVFNTMSIAVVQRRREIGLLRSLGTTAGAIRTLFLVEATILSAIGSVAGLLGGVAIARTLIPIVERVMGSWILATSVRSLHVGPLELAAALVAGVGVSLVATLFPSVQAGRISPLVALRRDAATRVAPRTLARLGWAGGALVAASFALGAAGRVLPIPVEASALGAMASRVIGAALLMPVAVTTLVPLAGRALEVMFGIQGRLAADNLKSAPGRTAVTLTAILIGIAAYVIVATLMRSLDTSLSDWLDHYIASDLSVSASSRVAGPKANKLPGELVDEIRAIEGVRIVRPFRMLQIPYRGEITMLLSLDLGVVRRTVRYPMVEGPPSKAFEDALHRGEGVGVSDAFARKFGKHLGDVIELETPSGQQTFKIVGVFADWAGPTGSIHLDRALFVRFWKTDLVDSISIDLVSPADEQRVTEAVRSRFGARYDLVIVTSRETKAEITSQIVQGFQMTRATEVVVLLISALGVVNTLLAAILDRTREIGILRAIGATRGQVVRAVLLEASLLGTLGAAIGIALGLVTAYPFVKVAILELVGWHLDFHVDPTAVAVAGALAITISIAAAYYPARKASRLDVLTAIQYE